MAADEEEGYFPISVDHMGGVGSGPGLGRLLGGLGIESFVGRDRPTGWVGAG
jgi:hypothetical protein